MLETIISGRLIQQEALLKDCAVYRIGDGAGGGKATIYAVSPGIFVSVNEFDMGECTVIPRHATQVLGIEYCVEGRMEWEYDDGRFCYLSEGDLQISTQAYQLRRVAFPGKHYRGVSVGFAIDQADTGLKRFFPEMNAALSALWRQHSAKKDFFILRSERVIRNIFSDLYQNAEKFPIDYLRVKVMELLLVLGGMALPGTAAEKPYFKRSQVEQVRKVKAFLCEHTDQTPTLQALCERFGLPLAVLKSCFKSIYGQSVYAFAKAYRLQKAAELLRTTEQSVLDIALDTGYATPSKFTAAFKERFAMCPLKYRKGFGGRKDFTYEIGEASIYDADQTGVAGAMQMQRKNLSCGIGQTGVARTGATWEET